MDPWRNSVLQNAKLQAILSSYTNPAHSSTNQDQSEQHSDMPAPPAYHMVVDPEARTPNMSSPYDPEEEEEKEDSEDDTPEITINAATQIRGNGNIISIAQMDSARIANLVATILSGEPTPSDPVATTPPTSPPQAPVTSLSSTRTEGKKKSSLNVNITINCGATIIGDRNIVGPGLGDIARQMQIAQRNAAMQAQQQQQQTQTQQQQKLAQGLAQAQAQKQAQMNLQHSLERRGGIPGLAQCHQNLYQSQAGLAGIGQVTPPMSRSGSFGSEGSPKGKRKAEDDAGEGLLMLKRRC